MSLKRMKRETKRQQEYNKYYESKSKGEALTYYQWKQRYYPNEIEKENTKKKTTSLKRIPKEEIVTARKSLEQALTKEEIARLNRKK